MIERINTLRIIAMVSVVLYHFNPIAFPNGYLGVDIFLIISGYLIFYQYAYHQRPSLILFTRLYRIYNMSLITILLILGIWIYFDFSLISPANIIISIVGSVANFLYAMSIDYFSPQNSLDPFIHFWSLSLEMQFYVVCAFLFFTTIFFKNNSAFVPLTISLFVLSLAIYFVFLEISDNHRFYPIYSRLWEFLLGGLIFSYRDKFSLGSKMSGKVNLLLLIFVLLVVLTPIGANYNEVFKFLMIFALCVVISCAHDMPSYAIEKSKLFLVIGASSFCFYLLHQPLLIIIREISSQDMFFLFLCLLFITGVMLHYGVERYVRKLARNMLVGLPLSAIATSVVLYLNFAEDKITDVSSTSSGYQSVASYAATNECIFPDLKSFSENRTGCTSFKYVWAFMGDSHSEQLLKILSRAGFLDGGAIVNLSKGGCAIDEPCFDRQLKDFEKLDSSYSLVCGIYIMAGYNFLSHWGNSVEPGQLALNWTFLGKQIVNIDSDYTKHFTSLLVKYFDRKDVVIFTPFVESHLRPTISRGLASSSNVDHNFARQIADELKMHVPLKNNSVIDVFSDPLLYKADMNTFSSVDWRDGYHLSETGIAAIASRLKEGGNLSRGELVVNCDD